MLSDGRVLVAGGDGAAGTALSSAELFSLDGSFTPVAPMTVARSKHVAVALKDGRVLVAGGVGIDGKALSSAEIYDPSSNVWQAALPMVEARSGATATLLADGKVLVAGGANDSAASASLEVFDPVSDGFVPGGMMSWPRQNHAAALLASGQVLLAGGSDGAGPLASSELWDSASGMVSPGPALSVARAGLSATTLVDGTVLLAGGNDGTSDLAVTEIFDPAAGTVVAGASLLSSARRDHLAVLLPHNSSVLVVGGTTGSAVVSTAELYLPWAGGSNPTGSPSTARALAVASPTGTDGLLLLAGGYSSTPDSPLPTAEVFGFATLKTDQDDYPPGQQVFISGSGWEPGDTVNLTLHETGIPTPDPDIILTVTADAAGNIVENTFYTDIHDVGVRFYLTAVGTRSQAQWTFTDAPKPNVTINSVSDAVLGPSDTSTTVNWKANQGSGTFSVRVGGTDCSTGTQVASGSYPTADSNVDTVVMSASLIEGSNTIRVCVTAGSPPNNVGDATTVVTKDTSAPAAPSTPDLTNGTDSAGASNSDNITNFTAPVFTGTTEAKSTVELFVDGVSRGTDSNTNSGNYSVTSSALAEGTHSVTAKATDLAGNVSGLSGALGITIDTTPPTMGMSPVAGNLPSPYSFSWNITDPLSNLVNSGVWTSTCSVTVDAALVSTSCSGSHTLSNGTHTVVVSARDNADNLGSETCVYTVAANTPPAVAADNASVTVNEGQTATHTGTWSDADASDTVALSASVGSVIKSGTNAAGTWSWSFATTDGPDDSQTVTITANDGNGGVTTTTFSLTVNNVAPQVAYVSPVTTVDEGQTKTYNFTVNDPGDDTYALASGFPDCGTGGSLVGGSFSVSGNSGSQTGKFDCKFPDGPATTDVRVRFTDSDGASGTASVTVTVSNVAPSVTITSPAAPNLDFLLNASVPLTASCTDPGTLDNPWAATVDWGDGSLPESLGPVTCNSGTFPASHTYTSVGSKTIAVTVKDKDNASGSANVTIKILYQFIGFLPPIDNPPVWNVAKAGRTIPVKWQLTDANNNYISDLASVQSWGTAPIACDASPASIVEEQLDFTGGTVLRYDFTSNQFIFNWQTLTNYKNTCRALQVTLNDGTMHLAKFAFTK